MIGVAKLVAAAGLAGVAFVAGCHHGASPAPQEASKIQAAVAPIQPALDRATSAVADQTTQKTVRILINTQEAQRAIETAPGADAPLPPDVLASWSAGIDCMRQPECAAAPAPGHGAGPAPAALPPGE